MPGIFYEPTDRRQFFVRATKVLAGIGLLQEMRLFGADEASGTLHLALLSDIHIPADPRNEYRGFYPWHNLKRIVPRVADANPQAVLVDGDLARLQGQLADYEAAKGLLKPLAKRWPIYLGLGNHDNRRHFFKVFGHDAREEQPIRGKHVLVMEWPKLRLVLLDSLLYTNRVAGLLGKAQRKWLGAFLEESDERPTILFVHHTLGDGDTDLLDADRMFRIVNPHRKVKAILYGHSHRYAYSEEDGVHLINLPAVGYNFTDAEPVGWVDAHLSAQGGDFKLNAFGGNRAQDGRTRSLEWRG